MSSSRRSRDLVKLLTPSHSSDTPAAYATVTGAGHMVPFKKHHAKSALAMINRWLDGQSL